MMSKVVNYKNFNLKSRIFSGAIHMGIWIGDYPSLNEYDLLLIIEPGFNEIPMGLDTKIDLITGAYGAIPIPLFKRIR